MNKGPAKARAQEAVIAYRALAIADPSKYHPDLVAER